MTSALQRIWTGIVGGMEGGCVGLLLAIIAMMTLGLALVAGL